MAETNEGEVASEDDVFSNVSSFLVWTYDESGKMMTYRERSFHSF